MNRSLAAVAVVAVSAAFILPGCFIESRRSTGHAPPAPTVRVERTYTYFPEHHAYYCEETGDWWVRESGSWNHHRERPSTIVIREDTPWLVVNVQDDQPQVRNADHDQDYEKHGKGGNGKGPPPGRGWRK